MSGRTRFSFHGALLIMMLLVVSRAANAQGTTAPALQSSQTIESETRAGGNFHSSFASSEFSFDGRFVVREAPFSAVGTKETTQVLSNGSRIVRRMTVSLYRDSEGRTRFEWGNDKKTEGRAVYPIIDDPVAGVNSFFRSRIGRLRQSPLPSGDDSLRLSKIITAQSPHDNITNVVGETIEPLGSKTIEGVLAEGVRVTTTIPGKEMTNGQPAKIIYERWYSQQLRRNILIRSVDPRFGEATYRLTSIERSEPARELFMIPAENEFDRPAIRRREPRVNLNVERGREPLVNLKFERGAKIAVENRSTGPIVIIGWDKDIVEARATSDLGTEVVSYSVSGEAPGKSVWLKADYAERDEPTLSPTPLKPGAPPEKPAEPAPEDLPRADAKPSDLHAAPTIMLKQGGITLPDGIGGVIKRPGRERGAREIRLEVHVPRYAEIEWIRVFKSPVEISGVGTPINVFGESSTVTLKNVGVVEVRTRSGSVEIENAKGFVDVITTSGLVRVRRAADAVRVFSINGDVEVECGRGRVNVDTTIGSVRLGNIDGDVDANSTNGNVMFSGPIRPDGRYHLKSMSGTVELALRNKSPGFTAVLSSYRGVIENDFQLDLNQASQHEESVNRRIVGRYGNGLAQIMLDTFEGRVKLVKREQGAGKECK